VTQCGALTAVTGDTIAIPIDETARVYEHGWQSWSPSTTYSISEQPPRATDPDVHVMNYRPGRVPRPGAFQGEGLLAVQAAAQGPVHVFTAGDPAGEVPSIAAVRAGDALLVTGSGPLTHRVDDGPGGIDGALARWADGFAAFAGVGEIRPAPTGWCSWYHYFADVAEADIDENLAEIHRLDLPIDVVQIDDGWQAEVGDWLDFSDAFASLAALARRIRDAGRRVGIWVAPFLLGERSSTARRHPEWIAGAPGRPVYAGTNWGQRVYALDTTHPGALAYVRDVFSSLVSMGVDYFKIDFIYAAAIEGFRHVPVSGVEAYRAGLRAIRAVIGDAYLVGCGAPILPSVGLVDAMRISPDTAPHWESPTGEQAHPSGRAAVVTGIGRAFQHARFWVNDADCLIVRPGVEHREELAVHVERFGGLRVSSDRLRDLDSWGLATTRRLLSSVPREPFVAS
jgi:alpha-galactosidase